MLKIIRRKESPFWQITGTYQGVRCRESTGTPDKAQAEKILSKRMREIDGRATGRRTVADAIEAYRANGGEQRYLDAIEEVLGEEPLETLSQETIDTAGREAYGGYKRGDKGKVRRHSKATIRRQFYVPLASVLHYAHEIAWMPYLRIKMPKADRPPPKWAEPEWFRTLWKHCDLQLKACTFYLMATGCRIQETLDLRIRDLNLKESSSFIPKTKTRAHRTVFLPDELVEVLKAWIKESPDPEARVFDYRTRHKFRTVLRGACKQAGIDYLSSHKIGGHTYGTYMRRYAGADSRDLTDTGRWSSREMADHYTHTAVSESSRKAGAIGKVFKK